jgi:hypothetical protein
MSATDRPFNECVKLAIPFIKRGATIYQKFTCQHCGARQTMTEPNKFFISGRCEECGGMTDIEARGCDFMMHVGIEA